MLKGLLGKIMGNGNAREMKRLQPIVDEINQLESEYERLSAEQLQALTATLKQEVQEAIADLRGEVEQRQQQVLAETDADYRRSLEIELEAARKRLRTAEEDALNAVVPRAFAAVREAAKRTLGERHFDEQIIGGIVLHQGKIAEMRTGEGKTLTATLPLYLNSLLGRGVHLVTPNDYLSKFGVQWMGPIYQMLGVSVGVIQAAAEKPELGSFVFDPAYKAADDRYQNLRPVPRREAYLTDITYGTNNEFGFDYLRDNMAVDLSQWVQRDLHYAIVDEVDNILIDEARTPLIISGTAEEATDQYARLAGVVPKLREACFAVADESFKLGKTRWVEKITFELSPGASRTLYFQFSPTVRGSPRDRVTVSFDEGRSAPADGRPERGNQPALTIPISGVGSAQPTGGAGSEGRGELRVGNIVATPGSIDFGSVALGQSEELPLTLQNMGQTRLMATVTCRGHYAVDPKMRVVTLTEEGVAYLERLLGVENLYSTDLDLLPYVENALKAQVLFEKDRDYVVMDGQVIIVDEFTGRLMYGRRYSEGLHQAIEAKEGVMVQRETLTLATITFQNYFRMYNKLAGMSGTAETEAEEFRRIYDLDVVVIPTHKPMIRQDMTDQVYKTERAKFKAIVQEIGDLHTVGRPVLVGTTSVEKSELLARLLKQKGTQPQVLNAKQHEREATIIAQAGRPGAVTIATNMAGRGVDILLGGKPDGLARDELRRKGVDLSTVDAQTWANALAQAQEIAAADKTRIVQLGGLHIIGTERHEARRIDNQLRGRSGRQGDPGSSRFFVSLEDDLMVRFGGSTVASLMDRLGVDEDIPIEHDLINRAISNAQVKVEGYNFDLRKHLLDYDDVVNQQRKLIYDQRRLILTSNNLKETILGMLQDELRGMVALHTAGDPTEWNLDALISAVRTLLPLDPRLKPQWRDASAEQIGQQIMDWSEQAYAAREQQLGPETMRQWERVLMLHVVDTLWMRHLTALDELREGIGLRALAQRDPLVEYKREAFAMFDELKAAIGHDVAHQICMAQIRREPARRETHAYRPGAEAQRSTPTQWRSTATQRRASERVGRNDPCPCGSGRKYKDCCMRKGLSGGQGSAPSQLAAAQAVATPPPAGSQHHTSKKKRR